MKTVKTLFAALSLAVLAPVALQAQTPFSVEFQAGAVIPTGDFGDEASTGFGLGVNAAYRIIPSLDIYAGYSWQRFGTDDGEFEGVDVDIDDSGFALGARLFVPGMETLSPWVRGGLIFHQLKVSGSEGGFSASFTSDRTLGFEAGAGLAFPVAPNFAITPAVLFRTYEPEFDGESGESVSYFGIFIGGSLAL